MNPFKNIQQIKTWANTTFFKQKENLLMIKKHPEGIFYVFSLENDLWEFKMTALEPYFFDGEMVN